MHRFQLSLSLSYFTLGGLAGLGLRPRQIQRILSDSDILLGYR